MSNHPNTEPANLNAVWRAVHELKQDVKDIKARIEKPSLWSKVWAERKWLAPTLVVVLGGIGAGLWYLGGLVVDRHVESAIRPIQSDIRTMSGDVQKLSGRIEEIDREIQAEKVGNKLNNLSSNPTDRASIRDAQQLLQQAQVDKLQLGSDIIARSGEAFVKATAKNPDAWHAVTEFLKYRSFLNSITVPLGPQSSLSGTFPNYKFTFYPDTFPKPGTAKVVGRSEREDAAQLRPLSGPDPNKDLPVGPSLLVLSDESAILDNLYVKNVVFANTHIIYKGGPVVLDHVYFLNCTFEIEKQTPGRQLAVQILAGPATTFSSG